MGNTLNNKKANGFALLPFLVFIVVYMGAGLVYQSKGVDMAFYQFPSVTAMFLAVLVTVCLAMAAAPVAVFIWLVYLMLKFLGVFA